ncbi:MAG: ATP-grasp domain-containing protein [Patescibacteria group bacterium]
MSKPILPGAVLGILGDGQLGRMLALAAAPMGYRVAVLGPGGRESPAGQVAYWAKAWEQDGTVTDELLQEFCSLVSVVLIEWENVPLDLLGRIQSTGIAIRPDPSILAIAQDRLHEKQYAQSKGIAVPAFSCVESESGLESVIEKSSILKTRRDGYDGKGQVYLEPGGSVLAAWESLGSVPCILEEAIDFVAEASVIVACPYEGKSVMQGPFHNDHRAGILRETVYPLRLGGYDINEIRKHLFDAARTLSQSVHGLLAVEFFVGRDGQVIFNEMAPRPHNSGHLTLDLANASQFELYIRAACNLSLNLSQRLNIKPGKMKNILGGEEGRFINFHPINGVVHWYGKESKPGRKIGHITSW